MQTDLDDEVAGEVQILGVNEAGHENGNDTITDGRDLPWLQETIEQPAWDTWAPTYRDVVIVDRENRPYAVYNLTENNLGEGVPYDTLKGLILSAVNADGS